MTAREAAQAAHEAGVEAACDDLNRLLPASRIFPRTEILANAAIRAYLAAVEAAGWKLVPVKPSAEMLDAAFGAGPTLLERESYEMLVECAPAMPPAGE